MFEIDNNKNYGTDAPYDALVALGEMGERVIDYYTDGLAGIPMFVGINCVGTEEERKIAMAVANLVYFIENDYRYVCLDDRIKNLSELKKYYLLMQVVPNVVHNVNNYNSERFFSFLNKIDADFEEFRKSYEEIEDYGDFDILDDFADDISDLIIDEFHHVEEVLNNNKVNNEE